LVLGWKCERRLRDLNTREYKLEIELTRNGPESVSAMVTRNRLLEARLLSGAMWKGKEERSHAASSGTSRSSAELQGHPRAKAGPETEGQ
jgi:Mn-dependent DtxR family transcriptional regulator